MKLPCKHKYVDEAVPDWSKAKNVDDTYDVVHADDIMVSVFRCLTKDQATEIVRIQNEFKTKLHDYMSVRS